MKQRHWSWPSRTRSTPWLACLAAVLVVSLASACGGSTGSSSSAETSASTEQATVAASSEAEAPASGETGATEAASGAGGVEAARALVEKYSAIPEFIPPGPSFDASQLKGKTIFSIPSNSKIPFVKDTDDAMASFAEQVGIKYITWPNEGQTAQYVQGVQSAIARQVDIISLIDGTDPRLIQPQIDEAAAAGIPVVDSHDLDLTQEPSPNLAATVDGDFVLAGSIIAASAIVQTDGEANVLVITSKNYRNSDPVESGIRQEFEENCPDCKLSFANVNGVDWPTKIQPLVQSSLVRDPSTNFIIPVFDSMLQYVVPGVIAANATGKVHAGSFNGTPAILDLIRTGDIVTIDVGENPADIAAAALDQCMRVLLGMPPSENEHLVLRAFTKDNIEEAGVPAKLGMGYGDAWSTGYLELWGVE